MNKSDSYFRELDIKTGKEMDRRYAKLVMFNPWRGMDSLPNCTAYEIECTFDVVTGAALLWRYAT